MYCGRKRPIPRNKVLGTPSDCFQSGLKVGYATSMNAAEKANRARVRTARIAGETAGTAAERSRMSELVRTRGPLSALKRYVRLNDLKQPELRAIASRLVNTPHAVHDYTHASKAALIQGLHQAGFRL
jgi:hypothetical protein